MKKPKMPAFRSEAAEARWWDEHREVLDRGFGEAATAGTLKKLAREEVAEARVCFARYFGSIARG